MALGLGSTIYQLFCPFITKKHCDSSDYVRVDGDSMSNAAVESLGKLVDRPYSSGWNTESRDNATIDIMRLWYRMQSESYVVARLLVTVFFIVGGILLAVPSAVSVVKIFTLATRHFTN